jgi:cytoskeletal protein RodZ
LKKEQKAGAAVIGFAALVIIGIASGGGQTTPAGNTSAIASASALASAVGSPMATTATATATAPRPTATATKAKAKVKPKPRRTAVRPAAPAPTRSRMEATPSSPSATAPAAGPSCYPLTNGGNCYEPGEFCRESDHGVSGVAGDGERIVCADNDGWRWEPA